MIPSVWYSAELNVVMEEEGLNFERLSSPVSRELQHIQMVKTQAFRLHGIMHSDFKFFRLVTVNARDFEQVLH